MDSGLQHSNSTLDKTGSGRFTIMVLPVTNELEAQGTGTFCSEFLVDITTTQSGNSHTQPHL